MNASTDRGARKNEGVEAAPQHSSRPAGRPDALTTPGFPTFAEIRAVRPYGTPGQ